jgi:hypothetical protein
MPTVGDQLIPVEVIADDQGTDDLMTAEHHSHGEQFYFT